MEQDNLTVCKCCGSDACYTSEFTTEDGPIQSWMCMTCGFTTNSSMVNDSDLVKEAEEVTADLIRDLKQVHDGLAYFPTVITMPNKGMIFPEPQKGGDWQWTVVKAVAVLEEKKKFPIPNKEGEYYENRMDMKNPKRFPKLEFMDAAEELGMFKRE